MKLVIVAKNPYYYAGKSIKPYLAGHSTGFIQPFIDHLLARGHTVTLISPKEVTNIPIEFSVFPKAPVSEKFLKDEKLYARISSANIAFTRKFEPTRIFSQLETIVAGEFIKQNYEIDNAERMLTASIF